MGRYNTDDNNISINFSRFPFCFRCVSTGKYTNKLKDSKQFFDNFKRIIEKDIPFFTQHTFDNIVNASKRHSHSIPSDSKEYSLVIEIVKELYKSHKNNNCTDRDFELFLDNNINDYHVWQLGVIGGVRLVGIRYSNVFYVMFIDYHHLVYPDEKHNSEGYELYNFCPMTNYDEVRNN